MEFIAKSPTLVVEALRHLYPDSSRRTLKSWLTNGRFTLDGKVVVRDDLTMQEGQVLSSKAHFKKAEKIKGLSILYEDAHLIVIDKPKGLLSVPLDDGATVHALKLLRNHLHSSSIFPVHRIDRDTSGVLLFAKGPLAREALKKLFETHSIERKYFAIVEGRMKESSGTFRSKLLELPSYDVVENLQGEEAITHFEVIHRSSKFTYLKLALETGKKHQIRVHLSRSGHPVLGDKRYGSKENPIHRLCLHAYLLAFEHPLTQKWMSIRSPLPKEFSSLYTSKEDAF